MKIHDRGSQWHIYNEDGWGFTINANYADCKGTVTGWELYRAPDHKCWKGETREDFIDLLESLVKEFDLKKSGKSTSDTIVIYTDNIYKIKGFFRKYITNEFNSLYVTLLNFFEFRDITCWKKVYTALEIADYAKYLTNNLFIPNKYWYLTPNQVPRRAIRKACNTDIAAKIFPPDYNTYKLFRTALFGGIVYVPYKNAIITDKLMCLDLTSAYIYDLLIEKHCMSRFSMIDTNNWEYYTESVAKTSIGSYSIKYSCVSNKIHCFKDVDGKNLETGEHTVSMIMTSIDLSTFMDLANVKEIKCLWGFEADLDTLPKYMLDEIVNQYIKKIDLKGDKEAYDLQKPILNGIFGDCIRNYDEKLFYETKRKPSVVPQWGIWCTSYAKKNLLKLANRVEGWVYSDTDSIYCFDNEYNRKLLEEYNEEARKNVKAFCDKYGYDFDKLQDLGTFKIEKTIKKFKAITNKVYMYTTTDGEFHLTAAGLNQDTIKVTEDLYDNPLTYGSRLYKYITEDGYYEEWSRGINNLVLSTYQASLINPQY